MKDDIKKNADKQVVGRVGEDIACNFLEKKGFVIVGRNYRKFIGEIDIIAKKDRVLHFVEVKTVSRGSIRHALDNSGHRAEDNIHPQKLKRLSRAINSYLSEKTGDVDCDWQCDAVIVDLFVDDKKAKVKYLENIFA